MNKHLYIVHNTGFVGTGAEVTREYGSRIWDFWGEAIDHSHLCTVCVQTHIDIPVDPFYNPEQESPMPF